MDASRFHNPEGDIRDIQCPASRIAVGIATRGRASILRDTIGDLRKQKRPPDTIFVAYTDSLDIADAADRFPDVHFLLCEPGLTRQRNQILIAASGEDILTFLDDDFYLHPEYLSVVQQVFQDHPSVMVATGHVLADGINGPGLTFEQAVTVLARPCPQSQGDSLSPTFNAYGCNMSFRIQPIRDHGLRFDEKLPLYGWYEDVDFSRQLAPYGDIVKVEHAYGVHLGSKSGRQSGFRLGYSQVANPFYLARKRSVPWSYAFASMASRSMKNLVRSVAPEPFVDRKGRLRGNIKGWAELLSGRLSPTRILEL